MHNFPEGKKILCNKIHTLKEAKDILKLCIDHDVPFHHSVLDAFVDIDYPRFTFTDDVVTQSSDIPEDCATVSLEEFKNFIQGKGDEKKISKPFEDTMELNYQYKATVTKKGVKVGCTDFTHEKIAELYNLSQKAQKAKK